MEVLISVLPFIQIGLAVLLVAGILLQRSDASMGGMFAGGGDGPTTQFSRRGVEKQLFSTTVAIAILFVLSNVLAYLL